MRCEDSKTLLDEAVLLLRSINARAKALINEEFTTSFYDQFQKLPITTPIQDLANNFLTTYQMYIQLGGSPEVRNTPEISRAALFTIISIILQETINNNVKDSIISG